MRRDYLVGVLVAVLFATAASLLVAAQEARADVCDDIPSIPMVPNPVKAGCKVASKIPGAVADPAGAVSDVVTAPIKAAGDEVMQGVTKWVASGASWLVEQTGKLIDETTTPRLDSDWFGRQYQAGLPPLWWTPDDWPVWAGEEDVQQCP